MPNKTEPGRPFTVKDAAGTEHTVLVTILYAVHDLEDGPIKMEVRRTFRLRNGTELMRKSKGVYETGGLKPAVFTSDDPKAD